MARVLGWAVVFLLFVIGSFNYPLMPSADLDPSWRMALGYFSDQGMQFGKDVVFTYGPLGFVMGKTFSGIQFWGLIAGQLTLAIISGVVLLRQGLLIKGTGRWLYFPYMLLFGISYEDALHMLVICLLGFELLRLKDARNYLFVSLVAAVLAIYAQIKFTDLLLAVFIVVVVVAYGVWRRQWLLSAWLGVAFTFVYVGIWIGCGQQFSNLAAYLRGSWEISQGYQWAMGFPSPPVPLFLALTVLGVLLAYIGRHLWLQPDKPRAVANALLLSAFLYLNWKHGFVRADGHMIGFFICALLPLTAYPFLLGDLNRHYRLHRWVFAAMILISVIALEKALWGVVRQSLAIFQGRIWGNIENVVNWNATRQRYRDQLSIARAAVDLHDTRKEVGQHTLDVVGFEQGAAILNRFNYRPRPVIQSYSAFTPYLARINGDFFASEHAPDYVLMKIQTIDGRLPVMDDSLATTILAYRYKYVLVEKGFDLWKRDPGAFDAAAYRPRLIRRTELAINQDHNLETYNSQPIWIRIDLQPSLLGKLRSFLYKPPQVTLRIQDTDGALHDFLMPLPQGRTGFIVNPIIENSVDYMRFANNAAPKVARAISLRINPGDEIFFATSAEIDLASLPVTNSSSSYFSELNRRLFHMFKSYPVSYSSSTPLSASAVDDVDVAVLHAPSQMVFEVPKAATLVRGRFGFLPGTYTNGGETNGAEFVVYWSNGSRRVDLFRKFLNPLNVLEDRGLHEFECELHDVSGGLIYLEIKPGPYENRAWDWTAWSGVEIK